MGQKLIKLVTRQNKIKTPVEVQQYAQHKADQIAQIAQRSGRPITAIVQQAIANELENSFRQGVLSVRNG